jgi:lipoprotein signal peptidase
MMNSLALDPARRSGETEAAVAGTCVRAAWIGVPVLVADQAIKLVTRADAPLCTATVADCVQVSVAGPLTTMSVGQAGGMLGLVNSVGLWALIGLVTLASILFYLHHGRAGSWTFPLALGLQLAGALATLLDWLLIGTVTVPLLVNDAPLLNPAGSAVLLGTALLLVDVLAQLVGERSAWDALRSGRSYWLAWRGLGRRWPRMPAG